MGAAPGRVIVTLTQMFDGEPASNVWVRCTVPLPRATDVCQT